MSMTTILSDRFNREHIDIHQHPEATDGPGVIISTWEYVGGQKHASTCLSPARALELADAIRDAAYAVEEPVPEGAIPIATMERYAGTAHAHCEGWWRNGMSDLVAEDAVAFCNGSQS